MVPISLQEKEQEKKAPKTCFLFILLLLSIGVEDRHQQNDQRFDDPHFGGLHKASFMKSVSDLRIEPWYMFTTIWGFTLWANLVGKWDLLYEIGTYFGCIIVRSIVWLQSSTTKSSIIILCLAFKQSATTVVSNNNNDNNNKNNYTVTIKTAITGTTSTKTTTTVWSLY